MKSVVDPRRLSPGARMEDGLSSPWIMTFYSLPSTTLFWDGDYDIYIFRITFIFCEHGYVLLSWLYRWMQGLRNIHSPSQPAHSVPWSQSLRRSTPVMHPTEQLVDRALSLESSWVQRVSQFSQHFLGCKTYSKRSFWSFLHEQGIPHLCFFFFKWIAYSTTDNRMSPNWYTFHFYECLCVSYQIWIRSYYQPLLLREDLQVLLN